MMPPPIPTSVPNVPTPNPRINSATIVVIMIITSLVKGSNDRQYHHTAIFSKRKVI